MNYSAILIVNPRSGSFSEDSLKGAIEMLRAAFSPVEVVYTEKGGDAESIARESREDFDLFIAAGGDGTFNEVANGLAFTGRTAAFLPSGTTNVLAYEFGLPQNNLSLAAERIIRAREHDISLGRAGERFFVSMAGIGFDAETVYRVSPALKTISGKGAHIIAGLMTLAGYRPERLEIAVDGRVYHAFGLIVCNGRCYAGPYHACPSADIQSDSLDILLMRNPGRLALVRTITGVIRKSPGKGGSSSIVTGRQISIAGRAPIQVDGEFIGFTPREITVHPKALRVRY
jgi:YegS/Rv2252/BmrU family lipid kinase